MDNVIYCDIETVSGMNKPSADDIKAPANYKDPIKIQEYQLTNVEEAWRKQALDSMKGEIICIGFAMGDGEIHVIHEATEQATIYAFANQIKLIQGQYHEVLKWCGWNIQTFDLPWLWRKAVQYGIGSLRDAIPKDNRNFILDLMKIWSSDFKDYNSLESVAKFLGIKHEGGRGSEIHDLWQIGENGLIDDHCRRDIETVREIHYRIGG